MSTFEFADSMSFLLNSTPLIGRRVSGSTWGVNLPPVSPLPPPSEARDNLAGIEKICLKLIRRAGKRGLTNFQLARKSAPFRAMSENDQQETLWALQDAGMIELHEIPGKSALGRRRVAWVALEKGEEDQVEMDI